MTQAGLAALALVLVGVRAQEPAPDEVIIIDEAPAATADSDDEIIIIDEGESPPPSARPRISGALGRLWETWHVAADSDIFGALQLVPPEDGAWRMLGSVWLESWLLPAPNLSLYGNGFGRAALDGTPTGKLTPFADFYEAYAKITVERAAVALGRIVVPWGRTRAAALGDRVNPPDHRRGPPFPDPVRQKQPLWGGSLKTSLGSLGIEGVAIAQYEPSEGSLAASNQGGVRIARYQQALVRSPARAGGLLADDDTAALRGELPLVASGMLAGRAWRRVGDVDISGSVVWGYDETPRLRLRPDVARALAAEALSPRPGAVDDISLPCEHPTLECVGGRETLIHERTTSLSLDASWGLGIIIVRGEVVAYPNVGLLGGKQAILVDDLGLRSETVSQYSAALAVEGGLGDWVEGSIEVFDVIWDGVPAGATLWGVELLNDVPLEQRQVHRAAVGATLGGSFLDHRFAWKVRGEAGLLQPDVLVSAELRFRLPVFGMYMGGRADAFTGVPGSPGWMRQDATLVGVFIGEGT